MRILKKISSLIYTNFIYFWTLITAAFILVALCINWEMSLHRSYKEISEVATDRSNSVDKFVEDLFQDVYSIPFYEKKFSDCDSSVYPFLERILLNNPKVSGLIVSYDNKKVCSTLTNISGFVLTTSRIRSILGPFKLNIFDQPVYVIQQKIGHYHIGIVVLASIFKTVLRPYKNSSSIVGLYDNYKKQYVLKIEYNSKRSEWVLSNNNTSVSRNDPNTLFAQDKLHSIDEINVVVFENHNTLLRNLWYSELFFFLFILIISYLLYLLMQNLIAKHYSLLGAMKLAIKNREFFPEYQPIFDREAGKYSGVEILLRWQNNQDKIIMPDFFIQEAELTGVIIPITLQIIEIAFKETKVILDNDSDFHLAFNLSALHFTDATFFNKFNVLVEQYDIFPRQVIFEITERDLLDKNNSIFTEKMQELRMSGFSLAVDDYGTGHASISYLQHFPFNHLKIDKLFIQAIGTKAITESLNDAIISMAKQLNLIIVAEGVETEEQVKYLSENGVRFLQGWYFSKAISIENLINLLKGEQNDSIP